MKLETLRDLYIEELKDIYSAEQQLLEALPKMATAAKSRDLKEAFKTHTQETKGQVKRLEQIFEKLGRKPTGKTCTGMRAIIGEGEKMMEDSEDPHVLDAGLIAGAQKVEHYEIASYGTVRTYAAELGENEACKLLQQTLDEEGQTDKKLTRLAVDHINLEAAESEKQMAA
jgi:ferritin-like metal-binding protein YciE